MADLEFPLIVFSKTRTETDWECRRKRYLHYEANGTGYVSVNSGIQLFLGQVLHDSLAAIALNKDIDEVASAAATEVQSKLMESAAGLQEELDYANEQAALTEGIIRGFHKHVWPILRSTYPIVVDIEKEIFYKYDRFAFTSRPDLLLRNTDGKLVYIEYKSTSSKKEEWINSWNTAVQLHSSIRAIEQTYNEKVDYVIVQGLYKGYQSYGKQNSPFVYAYRRAGNPPFSETELRYDYKSGFTRYPTWELPGGVRQWVADMPREVLAEQFPQTPPIFVKDELVDAFFRQRLQREKEIELAREFLKGFAGDAKATQNILDTVFEQNFSKCQPSFGYGCPYKLLCHSGVTDPSEHGFIQREPQPSEIEFAKGGEDNALTT